MTQIEYTQAYFNGSANRHRRESNIHLLNPLGFNGKNVTLLKYVEESGPGVYCSQFGKNTYWKIGHRTEEPNWTQSVVGNAEGLYAAGISYFIKYRINYPILLVDLQAADFINTNGEVVVAKALTPLDVLDPIEFQDIKRQFQYASYESRKKIGQCRSWHELKDLLK